MAKKRDNPKRPTDRKPAVGGNLVWSLVAAGVASLFALSLVSVAPDVEISYSDLERLIDLPVEERSKVFADTGATRAFVTLPVGVGAAVVAMAILMLN